MIHETAIIAKSAQIDPSVKIGPYCIIDDNVTIGKNTILESHVVVKNHTTIGNNNRIFQFASIGEDPQDLKYNGEGTQLVIGDNNIFREYCTVNRGTVTGYHETKIGSDNLFMAYSHIAHDCVVGDNIIIANNAALAGHVKISDHAILGGFTAVHQFCQLGAHCMTGAGSVVLKDY